MPEERRGEHGATNTFVRCFITAEKKKKKKKERTCVVSQDRTAQHPFCCTALTELCRAVCHAERETRDERERTIKKRVHLWSHDSQSNGKKKERKRKEGEREFPLHPTHIGSAFKRRDLHPSIPPNRKTLRRTGPPSRQHPTISLLLFLILNSYSGNWNNLRFRPLFLSLLLLLPLLPLLLLLLLSPMRDAATIHSIERVSLLIAFSSSFSSLVVPVGPTRSVIFRRTN